MLANKLADAAWEIIFSEPYINCEGITDDNTLTKTWDTLNNELFKILKNEIN